MRAVGGCLPVVYLRDVNVRDNTEKWKISARLDVSKMFGLCSWFVCGRGAGGDVFFTGFSAHCRCRCNHLLVARVGDSGEWMAGMGKVRVHGCLGRRYLLAGR